MRHGSSNRRPRGRNNNNNNNNRRSGNTRTQVFDSNGPDVRIRGTAYQVTEKYLTLAKDALSSGDVVMYQNYMQHAEHYQRLINEWDEAAARDSNRNNHNQLHQQEKSKQFSDQPEEKENDDLGLPESLFADVTSTNDDEGEAECDSRSAEERKKELEAED